MHIGLIAADLSNENGWAAYSLNLMQQLQAQGIRTTVITAHNSPAVDFDVHRLLPALTPPERFIFFKSLSRMPAVRRLLSGCDVIHATVEPFAILAAAIAAQRPLFITAHGSYINLPKMRRFPVGALYRAAFRRSQLICVSRYTAEIARQQHPALPIHLINNGVHSAPFLHPPPLPRAKNAPTVITAGGIKPRKGTLQLVEALAVVREKIPNVQCLIMSSPQYGSAYTARVQAAVKRLRLEDSVHILGIVDDELKRAWFAAADVLALPAINDGLWFEGFGLVLVEAGAAGTAVIGTDGCGVADAIQHGRTGLVVAQENVAEELPRALLDLLSNPAKAAKMGAAGREKARQQTWASVARQVIALYEQALR